MVGVFLYENILLMWFKIRLTVLLLLLIYTAYSWYRDMHPNWDSETKIVIHPINIQKTELTKKYIQQLSQKKFDEIGDYLSTQASSYRGKPTKITVELGRELNYNPPLVYPHTSESIPRIMWWSLKFKLYSLVMKKTEDWGADSVMYLTYFDPNALNYVERSTALQHGRIGLVNLRSLDKESALNNFIIAHEAMHTFGAEDHYDLDTGRPVYPIGYAEPNKKPLYPQTKVELMGGYIPMNEQGDIVLPYNGLNITILNKETAQELGWKK